jgi:SNF2 family DNA or RNA helicase
LIGLEDHWKRRLNGALDVFRSEPYFLEVVPCAIDKANSLGALLEELDVKREEVIAIGDKVLVFSSFVEHLKLYKNYLDSKQITYCYLDGATKDRKKEVERFQNDTDTQIFLLSLKAGGLGLNLTSASYVFLLDPWWNPAAEAQAFDRAHRMGQLNKVFVYKFISRNTIEEKIIKLQEEKLQLFDNMINSDNEILAHLNVNDVMKLIE